MMHGRKNTVLSKDGSPSCITPSSRKSSSKRLMGSCLLDNNLTYKSRPTPWPSSCLKRFADDFKDKSDNYSTLYPSKRSSGNRQGCSMWLMEMALRPEPDSGECLHSGTPLCPSTTCPSGFPSSPTTTSRPTCRSL